MEQAQAALRLSEANLGYTTIRSPVDGVILARNVSEGQTVVASMSAQVLFDIATDLREIQVEASIPEADIGRVRAGQPVRFTVDAYDATFTGTVFQVRLSAKTEQNVVTYPVVIRADNPDLRLFPGMTANLDCEVARHDDALKAPNAALRFKPEGVAAPAMARRGAAGAGRPGTVWILPDPKAALQPVAVRLGFTDGQHTELLDAGGLTAGQPVILGVAENNSPTNDVVNPFALPHPPRMRPR